MFTSNASFERMLKKCDDMQVSKIIHKASIEINEKGTQSAISTSCNI